MKAALLVALLGITGSRAAAMNKTLVRGESGVIVLCFCPPSSHCLLLHVPRSPAHAIESGISLERPRSVRMKPGCHLKGGEVTA